MGIDISICELSDKFKGRLHKTYLNNHWKTSICGPSDAFIKPLKLKPFKVRCEYIDIEKLQKLTGKSVFDDGFKLSEINEEILKECTMYRWEYALYERCLLYWTLTGAFSKFEPNEIPYGYHWGKEAIKLLDELIELNYDKPYYLKMLRRIKKRYAAYLRRGRKVIVEIL